MRNGKYNLELCSLLVCRPTPCPKQLFSGRTGKLGIVTCVLRGKQILLCLGACLDNDLVSEWVDNVKLL